MGKFYILLFVFFIAISCKQNDAVINNLHKKLKLDNINSSKFEYNTKFKYTSNILVDNYGDYQIITLLNPWNSGDTWVSYLLYPKANKVDSLWPKTDFVVGVPVDRIAVVSASGIGFLDEINQLSNIVAISQKKFVYSPFIRDNVDNHKITELGNSTQINIEKILASNAELLIQTPFSTDLSNDSKIKATGINIAYNADWLETQALGRAEWIKFIALFCRKEYYADSVFTNIENRYNKLKKMAATYDSNVNFLVGGLYKDVWYMPAGESYKAYLFKDASTNYSWQNTKGIASLPLSIESVIKKQIDADYWIEAPYKTFAELEASNSRYVVFKAFKSRNVYHNLKQTHADGANNYWERGVSHPEEVLSDLISIFHHSQYHADLYYYERLR